MSSPSSNCMAVFLSSAGVRFLEGVPIPKPATLGPCVPLLALLTSISRAGVDNLVQEAFAAAFEPLSEDHFMHFWIKLPPYLQGCITAQQLCDDAVGATSRM